MGSHVFLTTVPELFLWIKFSTLHTLPLVHLGSPVFSWEARFSLGLPNSHLLYLILRGSYSIVRAIFVTHFIALAAGIKMYDVHTSQIDEFYFYH